MEVSSGAIVRYNDLYLLTKSPAGYWGFPKGHIEPGETKQEAAIREVQEETGLQVRLLEYCTSIGYQLSNGTRKRVFLFLAQAQTMDTFIDNKEVVEVAWVSKEQLLKQLSYRNAKKAFKELLGLEAETLKNDQPQKLHH